MPCSTCTDEARCDRLGLCQDVAKIQLPGPEPVMHRERPILFQGAMVRAILAGTKTQTRRAVKGMALEWLAPGMFSPEYVTLAENGMCPYGHPGDRLWVREAFMYEPADYVWEASVSIPSRPASTAYRADFPDSQPGEGWKPSIHMPRKLCRLELEVTGVRIERLQAISEEDAIAEGIGLNPSAVGVTTTGKKPEPIAVAMYRDLWESINGAGSWELNPWVWVVSFRKAS